jgi:hypothetical protein
VHGGGCAVLVPKNTIFQIRLAEAATPNPQNFLLEPQQMAAKVTLLGVNRSGVHIPEMRQDAPLTAASSGFSG